MWLNEPRLWAPSKDRHLDGEGSFHFSIPASLAPAVFLLPPPAPCPLPPPRGFGAVGHVQGGTPKNRLPPCFYLFFLGFFFRRLQWDTAGHVQGPALRLVAALLLRAGGLARLLCRGLVRLEQRRGHAPEALAGGGSGRRGVGGAGGSGWVWLALKSPETSPETSEHRQQTHCRRFPSSRPAYHKRPFHR